MLSSIVFAAYGDIRLWFQSKDENSGGTLILIAWRARDTAQYSQHLCRINRSSSACQLGCRGTITVFVDEGAYPFTG